MSIKTIRSTPNSRAFPALRIPAPTVSALTVATVAVLALAAVLPRPAAAGEINRIVLRVNEEILTLHEYESRKASEISTILADPRLDSSKRQEQLEQVGRMVMQSMFSEMLLLSFANQHSIRVSDSQVEESVRDLMKRQNIETQAQLQQALASSGMTMDELRANARREILWQQVVGREVQPKVAIGEEELRAYYRNHKDEFAIPEQRWLKEVILLEASGLSADELLRAAEEVRAALAAGGEPETVIAPYQEKGVSTGWIDLEWLRQDELETSLADAAWGLQPGDVSAPVAARGGYHVLQVAGLREAGIKPLSEVEQIIMRREYNTRFNRELRTFLADLEEKSYINENLPAEAAGYRALAAGFEAEDELELFRAPVLESPLEADGEENSESG